MPVPQSRVVIVEGIYALSARLKCASPATLSSDCMFTLPHAPLRVTLCDARARVLCQLHTLLLCIAGNGLGQHTQSCTWGVNQLCSSDRVFSDFASSRMLLLSYHFIKATVWQIGDGWTDRYLTRHVSHHTYTMSFRVLVYLGIAGLSTELYGIRIQIFVHKDLSNVSVDRRSKMHVTPKQDCIMCSVCFCCRPHLDLRVSIQGGVHFDLVRFL